jgi:hypothetical protein
MSDHKPTPRNCTLPPPVRGSHRGAYFANCEDCGHEYILVTNFNDGGAVEGFWRDRVDFEKWLAEFPPKEVSYERHYL